MQYSFFGSIYYVWRKSGDYMLWVHVITMKLNMAVISLGVISWSHILNLYPVI